MSGASVTIKWNTRFWSEVMSDPALASRLQQEADARAAAADAACGQGKNQGRFRNKQNFAAKVVTRQGSTSSYPVGLVTATNPRSIYKSQRHGLLRP